MDATVPCSDRSGGEATVEALVETVGARLGDLPGVVAVVFGGSRAAAIAADGSDLDLYAYAEEPPSLAVRAAVAGSATHAELDQRFWELGDAWIDGTTGLVVDVTYRSPAWTEAELDRVLDRHEASVGYSTAIWHNVRTARPLVDRDGWFAALQRRAQVPYPEALRRAIVAKNRPLLRGAFFAFSRQIEDALRRDDAVAVQHRLTAWVASYFDVVFALNRQTHPGEKRSVQYAQARSPLCPPDLGSRLAALFAAAAPPAEAEEVAGHLNGLLDDLDALLRAEGLLVSGA